MSLVEGKPRHDLTLTRDKDKEAAYAKSHDELAKKMQQTLGPKADGYFLFALEEMNGNKPSHVTLEVRNSRGTAADTMAGYLEDTPEHVSRALIELDRGRPSVLKVVTARKPPKRTCKLIARLEPTDGGKKLAEAHRRQLQAAIDKRFKSSFVSVDPLVSEAGRVADKTLEQKKADGNYVRYVPFR